MMAQRWFTKAAKEEYREVRRGKKCIKEKRELTCKWTEDCNALKDFGVKVLGVEMQKKF
jgi:hypothetical protein